MTEVEALIRKHASSVRAQIISDLDLSFDEIVDLAVMRATTIGQDEYGDASFHKSVGELRQERFDEHADAFFYGAVSLDKGDSVPVGGVQVGSVVRVLTPDPDGYLAHGEMYRVANLNTGTERSFVTLAEAPVRYWDTERFEVVAS